MRRISISTLTVAGFALLAAGLYAGFNKYRDFGNIRSFRNRADNVLNTASPTTPEEQAIADAVDFINDAIEACQGSGGSLQGARDAVNTLEQTNGFCTEGMPEMNKSKLATTALAAPGSYPGGFQMEYPGSVAGPPAVNINPAIIKTPATEASTAMLASVLVHEGQHAHVNTPLNTEYLVQSGEQDAYMRQMEFICCAISFAYSSPEIQDPDAVKDALCATFRLAAFNYYYMGGTDAIPDCGCWIGPPPSLQELATDSVPRPPIDPNQAILSTAVYRTSAGLFVVLLIPEFRQIEVLKLDGPNAGMWTIPISAQSEGTLDPFTMTRGRKEELFLAGRIQETNHTVIYRIDVHWNGAQPSLTFDAKYNDSGIGDLLELGFAKEMNGKLTMYDYSNAKISYVDLFNGNVTHLAEPSQYPELAQVVDMVVYFGVHTTTGVTKALSHTLQPNQFGILPHGSGVLTVSVDDTLGDGTVDNYVVSQ